VTTDVPSVARITSRGVELRIRLTPKSSSDRIEGVCDTAEGPALTARVRAVPSDGEANSALERLIADWLDLSKSSVLLSSGHKSRVKTVTLSGPAEATLIRLNDRLAARQATTKN
jgi:uncharacterized protein